MINTNRDIEIEAANKRIEALEDELKDVQSIVDVADAIDGMEATDNYQLAIEGKFLAEGTEDVVKHLAGDEYLPEEAVTGLNEALVVVRGYKRFVKQMKTFRDGDGANIEPSDSKIARIKSLIDSERKYIAEVTSGNIDLGAE